METSLQAWRERIGHPEYEDFPHTRELLKTYDYPDFTAELCCQSNGSGTFQRLLIAVPRKIKTPAPAVAVPFYFPEAMLGEELESRERLPFYAGIEMMKHLASRGYISASADSYHLTYRESTRDRNDFQRWGDAAELLLANHPHWSGIGKLVADTQLVIDALTEDPRVDAAKIGIAGHSLGGKMAFYTGCLDARVKVILASDFGIKWRQTNWDAPWYWGEQRVAGFEAEGLDHADLLRAAKCKPFALLAGKYDNDESLELMQKAGYAPEKMLFVNHATGHRPPASALDAGYDFIGKILMNGEK